MTSTSITTLGGVVVITQVIPQDEASILLQTPAAASTTQQALPPAAKVTRTAPTSSAKMDDVTTTFLRGQPHGLGVVQIFIGVVCILFSLTSVFSQLFIPAPFCLAAAFVVSGSLALAAGGRTSVPLVWACLLSHVMSVLVSLGGVVYLCWLLSGPAPSLELCTYNGEFHCSRDHWILKIVAYGLFWCLLVLLLLQLCVTITVCVFSGKTLRLQSHAPLVTVKVDDSDVALLYSEDVENSKLLPNTP